MSEGTMRPGNRAMKERWDWVNAFWLEKKRGPYDEDFTGFCIQFGLTDRTGRESYWDRGETMGIIRVVYEKKQKFWEYCNSTGQEKDETGEYAQEKSEEEPEAPPKLEDLKGVELRAVLESEYCEPCNMPLNVDCKHCSGYFRLTHRPNERGEFPIQPRDERDLRKMRIERVRAAGYKIEERVENNGRL